MVLVVTGIIVLTGREHLPTHCRCCAGTLYITLAVRADATPELEERIALTLSLASVVAPVANMNTSAARLVNSSATTFHVVVRANENP